MELKLKDIEAIYHGALEKEAGRERSAYLDSACGRNAALRDRVEALLKANEDAGNFLDVPPADLGAALDDAPLTEQPGTVIGRYKLLERIGEGGMAVVYMAEQTEPIRRKVALKIIKLGMDTRQVIARFEAERQALALMDHPNIAKVLDAGATETGRPYFVMELVKGVSITDYCDANSLSTKERLELFIQVCNAVQHAHQKGIIHRDIKPTNVMVTLHDGKSVPKVIDFGIAKAINQKLTEKTLFTRYAHIIGTPAYMSPEQAELSDLDIDTRTDIYSLGVLLYELLTGTPPFGEEELRKAGYIEMQRVIREQEPVKPSTRIRTSTSVRQWHRHPADDSWAGSPFHKHPTSSPTHCSTYQQVRGDLDWIVMKSLEKDRARRYETANGLALDIRRHIEHEPVLARCPSTTYRVQKFLRRHRSQTIAALAMVIFAGAVVVILSMWNQARLQLREAEDFKDRGILSQAREQYAKADREAALETIKPILSSRHVGPEAQLLHAGILVDNRRSDEAANVLGGLLNERREIAGATHALLARILWESASPDTTVGATLCGCPIHRAATRGRPYDAIEDHRRRAEELLPETAEAYFLRAMTAITVKEQLASLERALLFDPAHYESRRLRAFTYYASRKYDEMEHDALGMTILRPSDPLGYSLRAVALRELGKYKDAIAEYDNAMALPLNDNAQYMDLRAQRNEVFLRMGDHKRVIADAQECLKLRPDKPVFEYHMFCALTALGDYDKAEAEFREIVGRTPTARNEFREWCAKYVFDTLETGRSWHPPSTSPPGARSAGVLSAAEGPSSTRSAPARDLGAAFLPMVEAEETYHELSAKAKRVTTDGFSARWSPDGKKLAFSAGVHGYSGVAVFDPATKETDLMIVPGKDPRWSPDGKYIAFVRDCQLLRVSEFIAAERKEQHRLIAEEEVWVMNADGTQPRRLARGGWPSWSQDSTTIYYQSRVDSTLCSVSIEGQNAESKRIMPCSNFYPSVSSDNQRVAYLDGTSLKVKNLDSQTVIAEQPAPFATWGGAGWSPTGKELCLAGQNNSDDRTGLWIYSLDRSEPARTLDGQITVGSWSSDGTKLVFSLGPPYFEIWAADLDPNVSTVAALGPGQTPDEHIREMLAFYSRRIKADPQDAYAYSVRAQYYDYLHDREKATADMRRWSAILSGSDLPVDTPRPRRFASPNEAAGVRRVMNMPFNCQVVFSAERPVNEIPLLNVALGQKGRCNMKSFQIPIFSTRGLAMSLLGLCLLSGLDTPAAYADFTFGEPVKFGPAVAGEDGIDCLSSDGLEVYFDSLRSGGQGGWDIWVLRRASIDKPWDSPQNLGPGVNSSDEDSFASISYDGLTLYFGSGRPGGHGKHDIYMTTRTTKDAPWGSAVNLGPNVNSSSGDVCPWISADGLELYFVSARSGGYGASDIYVARRATTDDPWGTGVNLGAVVNSAYEEQWLSLSPDGLLLLFSERYGYTPRPGGYGGPDMWMTRRATLSDPWQAPVNLGPNVNCASVDGAPRISPDGRTLYFVSQRSGTWDVWQAPIIPTCDFNSDGIVDIADVAIMVEHWHTDYSLCDIGPYAWGDGFVDAQDLIVLAEYMADNPGAVNAVNDIQ